MAVRQEANSLPLANANDTKISGRPRAPEAAASDDPRPSIGLAEDTPYIASPARSLQARLAEQITDDAPKRWSRRQSFLFVLTVCGGFWTVVGLAASAALR